MTLFFGVFLAAGLLFTGMLGREVLATVATWTWQTAPCTVVSSTVTQDGSSFGVDISYRYQWEGVDHLGTTFTQGSYSTSDVSAAERAADRYAVGAEATCFVDPDDPAHSMIRRRSLWFAFTLLLPLVFVAVGVGGIWGVWRRKPTTPAGDLQPLAPAATRKSRVARTALLVLFGLFALAGGVATYFMLIRPAVRVLVAQGWEATPCRVLSSEVRSHRSDDGTTYSVEILYQYELQGRSFRGNRYDFLGGSSGGYEGKARVVEAHPVGSTTVCYVNPDDPHDTVLERGFRAIYLVGLVPLLFFVIGAAGLTALKRGRFSGRTAKTAVPGAGAPASPAASPPSAPGPVELRPQASPLAKLAGMTFFALFWNGITGVFVFQLVGEWRSGAAPLGGTLFMVPFVLIGLATLSAVGYFFLGLFNPRPILRLPTGSPALGDRLDVEWELHGSVERIRTFRIALTGREEATYRRGTNTQTDRETFADITVFESNSPWEMRRGQTAVVIPSDTMHTFTAPNNKVVWAIAVHGDIARWPDIDEDFAVDVLPRPLELET